MTSFKAVGLSSVLLTAGALAPAEMINLVALGKETFHSLGCGECHSVEKGDEAIRSGPGLYGLFEDPARVREVESGGERHRSFLRATEQYFQRSLRTPHADLAVAEGGATKGQAYLPVMPPYDEKVLSKQKARAIYAYLRTLNEKERAGPSQVMAPAQGGEASMRPEQSPAEVLVPSERTRIFRVRLKGSSARAVAVGTASGLNYTFDPRVLSFDRIWWGGFLNLKSEMEGRAIETSGLGYEAQELERKGALMRPIHPKTGKEVDLSFKSPLSGDFRTIAESLDGEVDFRDQLKAADAEFLGYLHAEEPSFRFRVGKNELTVRLEVNAEGQGRITLTGRLEQPQTFQLSDHLGGGQVTVQTLPHHQEFRLPLKPKTPWRPVIKGPGFLPQVLKVEPAEQIDLPAGYAAERIYPPLDPQGREQLFEPVGMDVAWDGSLVISTRTAGIWQLKDGHWTMIAEGLLDALGLIVEEDGSLVVAQKPELTRLRDRDGDGWMESYETLSEAFLVTSNYHEYLHGPAKDEAGNYYVQTNLAEHKKLEAIYKAGGKYMGTQGGYRGWALKVTAAGETIPYASGLRSPAGLATGPAGKIFLTENQGEYVGTSKLFLLEEGKFYGHPASLVDLPGMKPDSPEIRFERWEPTKEVAQALFPHARLANSPGSPEWDLSGGKFGPWAGQMFIGDQTLSQVFRVLPKGRGEAVSILFGKKFPSGVMRLKFTPDGSLYLGQTGRGWRAQGGGEAALVRVFRNGEPLENELFDVTRSRDAFTLHFTQPLNGGIFPINVESWHYEDSPGYGSAEKEKRKEEMIASPSLSGDRKSLTIHLKPQVPLKRQRVYEINSDRLPANHGKRLQAFYTKMDY